MAVRLLFDENLASRLVRDLAEVFPRSLHVEDLGLASADDEAVWMRSPAEDLMIVTKDDEGNVRTTSSFSWRSCAGLFHTSSRCTVA